MGDLCRLLSLLPANEWEGLSTFVFRQSTRKQWTLAPTWGRVAFSAELGSPARTPIAMGPALFLEAIDATQPWRWSTSLSVADSAELDRLIADGHSVAREGRYFELRSTPDSVRETQLYRTVLHEIGHWRDWLQFSSLDAYFARPAEQREVFAHRYATRVRERLSRERTIPFPRVEEE